MQRAVRYFGFARFFLHSSGFFAVKVCPIPRAAEPTALGTGSACADSRYIRRAPLCAACLTCSFAKISRAWVGNTQSARLYLASLPGIIISTNYDGISHYVNSYPPGTKYRRSNSFQADQIQISGPVSFEPLLSWAALSGLHRKAAPLKWFTVEIDFYIQAVCDCHHQTNFIHLYKVLLLKNPVI